MQYVSLGDSSAVGVGAARGGGYPQRLADRLRRAGVEVQHTNVGVSGAVAADVVGQAAKATRLQPDLVTIGVGGNDLWRMTPAVDVGQQLNEILAALTITGVDIFVLDVPDLSLAPVAAFAQRYAHVSPEQIATRVDEFNAAIAVAVADAEARARTRGEDRHHHLVDLCGSSRREIAGHPELFCSDGFHPSALGYDRYVALLWPEVVAALRRRGHAIAE